jgi:alpha/beta superfamily hydrolase
MMPRPTAEHLSIEGPAGTLEAIVEIPLEDSEATPYALVCHPHPLYGGTMENKVVTTLARAFLSAGVPALRFNFRGVGASAGTYDEGRGETDDAQAVAGWGRQRWPGRPLIIAGFSFGAYVAFELARKVPARRLITVAPPVGRFDFSNPAVPSMPWLIVQGADDEVVDPAAVEAWALRLDPPPHLVMIAATGHFFHGRLIELREAVMEEIRSGSDAQLTAAETKPH